MQLKLQRSQRAKGLAASKIHFCLDVRADYTADERGNINRYRLGPQIIYSSRAAQKYLATANAHLDRTQEGTTGNRLAGLAHGTMSMALAKMQLNISIASLGRGHHIECDDLQELLESEDTIKSACKDLTRYLEAAATFDGSEVVVEYVNGEERIHVAQAQPPLLEYGEAGDAATGIQDAEFEPVPPPPSAFAMDFEIFEAIVKRKWREIERGTQTLLEEMGLPATPLHARILWGLAGVALVFVLYRIF